MELRARSLLLSLLLLCLCGAGQAVVNTAGRFDLIGPKIDVRVTRGDETLPIAAVPNLQPGDKLWIHPDLPSTQSVKYLLICVFLRGNTNPPPDDWFFRIETWNQKIREEGTFITVPKDAQQAVLFMAPETGGDFSTLRSAVRGRPGAFVRASQDLIEAGFEEARIEKYVASIRRVPPSDTANLLKHSDLLARTLDLKPNGDCFKQPVDTQFTCLTQTGAQIVLDDGHGQSMADALNGPTSDLIAQASYTSAAGGGAYSAYVGAIVDVVRIMGKLHTAQFQYIPAITFPQGDALNLRLNTPPSFHNPKSVLVVALPAVQEAAPPPLRPTDANEVTCLIEPSVVLPIEGAPLVFSTDFAHNLVLHLNTPPGVPAEPDIPLTPDPYLGGLVLQKEQQHHVELHDSARLLAHPGIGAAHKSSTAPTVKSEAQPVLLTGTIHGRWGFDSYTGPDVHLQQLPGSGWTIVPEPGVVQPESGEAPSGLIAGHEAKLYLTSTGSACVHTITARPTGYVGELAIPFKHEPKPDQPNLIALTLPLEHDVTPGDLHLAIQQFDQPNADDVAARTFSEPATIASIELHAGDRGLVVKGTRLGEIEKLKLGDLVFSPAPEVSDDTQPGDAALLSTLHFALPPTVPTPQTHLNDHLKADIRLRDGRSLTSPVVVSVARPSMTLLSKAALPVSKSDIILSNPNDLPLTSLLTFTLKSPNPFPRNGQIEIETVDGTLRTVLTLAPSGGLLLQDPRTVVATLDPLRSFGPSAFGALRMRAIYPVIDRHSNARETEQGEQNQTGPAPVVSSDDTVRSPASDWLPLVTLVRLPTFSQLQCPLETTMPCTLTGNNFFLLQAVSSSTSFADPVPVPDGYTGSSLSVPHPAAGTIFFKLRDDPGSVNSVELSAASASAANHVRKAAHAAHSETEGAVTETAPVATRRSSESPASEPSTEAVPSGAGADTTAPKTAPPPPSKPE